MDDQVAGLTSTAGSFDFSLSYLLGGFVFGVIGLYLFREAKRRVDFRLVGISIALMAFPLFVHNSWLVWGIGALLCTSAIYVLKRAR